jgi:hypothetical protein
MRRGVPSLCTDVPGNFQIWSHSKSCLEDGKLSNGFVWPITALYLRPAEVLAFGPTSDRGYVAWLRNAGGILDIAMAGTSATLLARKWESPLLVNVDNDPLRRVLDNPEAMAAVEQIEAWRSLGDNIIVGDVRLGYRRGPWSSHPTGIKTDHSNRENEEARDFATGAAGRQCELSEQQESAQWQPAVGQCPSR